MKKVLYTPASSIQIYNKVKDSKFYGSISAADNRQQTENFISKIKKKYSDASHNVAAYKIGCGNEALQYSDDDGEPAGSSGPPVLQVIEGEELTNTVIVVTRYFGGTKLGIGGLIRAYGNTARMAVKEAGKKKLLLYHKIKINISYEKMGTVMGILEAFHCKFLSSEYSNDGVEIMCMVKADIFLKFRAELIEKTANKIKIEKSGNKYL